MARTILILGEGERDVGREGERPLIPRPHEGDLPRLLRRLSVELDGPERFAYEAAAISTYVRSIPRGRGPTRSGGKSKDLRDAIVTTLRTADPPPLGIVAVIDATPPELGDLDRDVGELLRQCAALRGDVPILIGLAVPEIEAWILADPEARRAASPHDHPVNVPPEELEDAKHTWLTLCGEAPVPPSFSAEDFLDQQRAAAWEAMRPDVVARACPRFARFRAEALAWIEEVLKR